MGGHVLPADLHPQRIPLPARSDRRAGSSCGRSQDRRRRCRVVCRNNGRSTHEKMDSRNGGSSRSRSRRFGNRREPTPAGPAVPSSPRFAPPWWPPILIAPARQRMAAMDSRTSLRWNTSGADRPLPPTGTLRPRLGVRGRTVPRTGVAGAHQRDRAALGLRIGLSRGMRTKGVADTEPLFFGPRSTHRQ